MQNIFHFWTNKVHLGLQHKEHPENGFLRILKLRQNMVNFHTLAKYFFFWKQMIFGKKLPKPAIVQLNDKDQTKPSGFVFLIRIPWFEKKNQTEQTVNRKISGFRAAPKGSLRLHSNFITPIYCNQIEQNFSMGKNKPKFYRTTLLPFDHKEIIIHNKFRPTPQVTLELIFVKCY